MNLLAKLVGFYSKTGTVIFCIIVSFLVLGSSLLLQWVVYDDWLHETGPFHILGSALAAIVTFVLVYERQRRLRQKHEELLRYFRTVADMNDRIRNALQVIEFSTYATNPNATGSVRTAVETIEGVLANVLVDFRPSSPQPAVRAIANGAGQKSA